MPYCKIKNISVIRKTSRFFSKRVFLMENDVRKILLLDRKTDRLTGTKRTDPSTHGQTLSRTNRPTLVLLDLSRSKLTYPDPYSV